MTQKIRMTLAWGLPILLSVIFVPLTFSWTNLCIFVAAYAISCFGVTCGMHRYLTHRSFECGPILKIVLLLLGCSAFSGSPLTWVSVHSIHHLYTDTEKDPHSPKNGIWNAYIGWTFKETSFPDPKLHTPREFNDPIIQTVSKYYVAVVLASLVIPYVLFGFDGFIWGGVLRIVGTMNIIGLFNVMGHMEDVDGDAASDSPLLALLTLGEGWHQQHHLGDPTVARHGQKWWQLDINWLIICLLQRLGLVWNVRSS